MSAVNPSDNGTGMIETGGGVVGTRSPQSNAMVGNGNARLLTNK